MLTAGGEWRCDRFRELDELIRQEERARRARERRRWHYYREKLRRQPQPSWRELSALTEDELALIASGVPESFFRGSK